MDRDKVAYLRLLVEKHKELGERKISDMDTSEIMEYMNLRNEIAEEFGEVKEVVKKVWESVLPYVNTEIKAHKRYNDRIKRGD